MEEDEIAPPLVATGFGRSSNGIKDGGGGGSCGSQPVEVRASSILFLPTPLERGVVSEVSERATTMSERSLGTQPRSRFCDFAGRSAALFGTATAKLISEKRKKHGIILRNALQQARVRGTPTTQTANK